MNPGGDAAEQVVRLSDGAPDDLSQPLETTYELLSEEDVEKEISVGTD